MLLISSQRANNEDFQSHPSVAKLPWAAWQENPFAVVVRARHEPDLLPASGSHGPVAICRCWNSSSGVKIGAWKDNDIGWLVFFQESRNWGRFCEGFSQRNFQQVPDARRIFVQENSLRFHERPLSRHSQGLIRSSHLHGRHEKSRPLNHRLPEIDFAPGCSWRSNTLWGTHASHRRHRRSATNEHWKLQKAQPRHWECHHRLFFQWKHLSWQIAKDRSGMYCTVLLV